ncbi:MAG: pseudouridine-5'-phosphate glycosidase [Thermaerobacter sp.]
MRDLLHVHPEVAEALAAGRPVVALESTLIAHGLPRPRNLEVARRLEAAVRSQGAVPAVIALLDGRVHVGLDAAGLERVAAGRLPKLGLRDLPLAAARGGSGATTVASTAAAAAAAGIRVFATGGLGGVHRAFGMPGGRWGAGTAPRAAGPAAPPANPGPPAQDPDTAAAAWDVSADLPVLARTSIVVVCSGVKSILDIGATLEVMETLSIPVMGWRTDRFPAFYLRDSGYALDWRADRPEDVAAAFAALQAAGLSSALVLVQPVPPEFELDPHLHAEALARALEEAAAQGIRGKAATPFVLARFAEYTGGASVDANAALVEANARLAAQVAVALAGTGPALL